MFNDSTSFSSFAVDDPEKARAFYGDTLGLDVRDSVEPGLLELHLTGGATVLLYPKGDSHVPAEFTVLNFVAPDIDTAVGRLNAAGIQMERFPGFEADEKGISRGGPGPSIAWFKDPAGNILSVLEASPT